MDKFSEFDNTNELYDHMNNIKNKGYDVVCTEINPEYCHNSISKGLNCLQHDTRDPFPFKDKQFDLVYSRLGLHYFEKDDLVKIFKELSRITNYLLITVKLTDNVSTGKIIFNSNTWKDLVSNNFDIEDINIKNGNLYGIQSQWLEILSKSN